MRNSIPLLIAFTAILGFAGICAGAPEEQLTPQNLVGYWVNSVDNDDIIHIEASPNPNTRKFELRLLGFNLRPYLITTIDLEPSVLEITADAAKTKITRKTLRQGEEKIVSVDIEFRQVDENNLRVFHRSNSGAIFERFTRLSDEEGAYRFFGNRATNLKYNRTSAALR